MSTAHTVSTAGAQRVSFGSNTNSVIPPMVERRVDLGLLERALSLTQETGRTSSSSASSARNDFVQSSTAATMTIATGGDSGAIVHDNHRDDRGRTSPVPSYHERPPAQSPHSSTPQTSSHSQTQQCNSQVTDPESQISSADRPPLKNVIRTRPVPFVVLAILVVMLLGTIAGWIVFMRTMTKIANARRGNGEGDGGGVDGLILVGNGGFVLLLLISIALILRQILLIYALIRPPPPRDPSQPTILNLPPWLLPTPPAYSESPSPAQGPSRPTQRMVEVESLPVYGQTRGSKLLLRSESRGGSVRSIDLQSEVDQEDDEDRVGVVVLYQPSPAPAAAAVPASASAPTPRETGSPVNTDLHVGRRSRGNDQGLSVDVVEVEVDAQIEADEEQPVANPATTEIALETGQVRRSESEGEAEKSRPSSQVNLERKG
ncbi:hypothetical protein IAT40_005749 [Kwoniella sp. CBS 6097]